MSFDSLFEKVVQQKKLSEKESDQAFSLLFKEKLSMEQAKAFLILLAVTGETNKNLNGCLNALRRLEKPKRLGTLSLIDTCGTGGDGASTINISSMSAIVAAAAGAKVAKHGNRAITSRSGSSDFMKSFGVELDISQIQMEKCLKKTGLGYFHAPFYHPVFAKVQPLRKQIKTRTIFNLLGPLVNPFVLSGQVIGVSKGEHMSLFASVLKARDVPCGIICHSHDGLDEVSTSSKSDLMIIRKKRVMKQVIDPKQYGFKKARLTEYAGGSARENCLTAKKIFSGKLLGPKRDIVVFNAALAIFVSGLEKTIEKSLELATEVIDKGLALEKIHEVASFTRQAKK